LQRAAASGSGPMRESDASSSPSKCHWVKAAHTRGRAQATPVASLHGRACVADPPQPGPRKRVGATLKRGEHTENLVRDVSIPTVIQGKPAAACWRAKPRGEAAAAAGGLAGVQGPGIHGILSSEAPKNVNSLRHYDDSPNKALNPLLSIPITLSTSGNDLRYYTPLWQRNQQIQYYTSHLLLPDSGIAGRAL
jgi:hypothetical protein